MKFIEQLVECLAGTGNWMFQSNITMQKRHASIVQSIGDQVAYQGKAMTQKQADIMVNICRHYKKELEICFKEDLTQSLDFPQFKYGIRTFVPQDRRIEIDTELKDKIAISFPYDEKKVAEIRNIAKTRPFDIGTWDADNKKWLLPLTESNVLFCLQLSAGENFAFCDRFQEFVNEIEKIKENFEEFVPQLVKVDDNYSIINAHRSVPQPLSQDLVEVLFHCRKYGITVFSEEIENEIKEAKISKISLKFLKKSTVKNLTIDSNEHAIDEFDEIVKNSCPILLVIPVGKEISELKTWYNYLAGKNIEKSEISVMFRKDNETASQFNDLVRGFGLNNPITENTKVVIVSQKMPKPVIKSGINFNTVINLNVTSNSHYTLSQFLTDHPDVIQYYTVKNGELL